MIDTSHLIGGYKIEYDVVAVVSKLKRDNNADLWDELWENLYHQGDIGTASLYYVVLISDVIEKYNITDFNPISMVVAIELARKKNGFEKLPSWIEVGYQKSIKDISFNVSKNLVNSNDKDYAKCGLALLAINNGLYKLGALIYEISSGDEGMLLEKYFK